MVAGGEVVVAESVDMDMDLDIVLIILVHHGCQNSILAPPSLSNSIYVRAGNCIVGRCC